MALTLEPISGQPGLFRRTGLRGLGTTAAYSARLDAAWSAYTRLKDDTQALLDRFPVANDPSTFSALVNRIVDLPRGGEAWVRLSSSQFATILKGALSIVVQNLGTAYGLAYGPRAAARSREISKLISSAENVTAAMRRIVDSLRAVADTADMARRAVGLSDGGASIALLLVAGAVAVVEIVLLVALVAYIASAIDAHVAAERACAADAAAGQPCTGSTREAYRERALEQARSFGLVPDIRGAAQNLSDAISGVVWLGGAALFAYFVWTTLPAAREARGYLTEETQSFRRRRRGAYR